MNSLQIADEFIPYLQDGVYYAPCGAELARVTHIIRASLNKTYCGPSAAAEIGTHVHMALRQLDDGVLDSENLSPALVPYIESYKSAKDALKITPLRWEQKILHPDYAIGGTIDLICTVNGEDAIIDIKTGHSYPDFALQTAAYAEMLSRATGKSYKRACLYIKPNSYDIDWHEDIDWPAFLSCYVLDNWKISNKLGNRTRKKMEKEPVYESYCDANEPERSTRLSQLRGEAGEAAENPMEAAAEGEPVPLS